MEGFTALNNIAIGEEDIKVSPEILGNVLTKINVDTIYLIYVCLKRQLIDPDTLLMYLVPFFNRREYLILTAFALRAEANPNLYIRDPKYGTAHILTEIYLFHGAQASTDENILISIDMLLIKGARTDMPAYDNKGGEIQKEFGVNKILTVNQWIKSNKYPEINKIRDDHKSNLLLNIDDHRLTSNDIYPVIKYYSSIILPSCPIDETKVELNYNVLIFSIAFFNVDAFKYFCDQGYEPTYTLMNTLIIQANKYKDLRYYVHMNAIIDMIIYSINIGICIDSEQSMMISYLGPDIYQKIMSQYTTPYWRKVCKIPDSRNVPEKLKRTAAMLDIDPSLSKKIICDNIDTISKADKDTIREAAIKRQEDRLSNQVTTINEYSSNSKFVCSNDSLWSNSPSEYSQIDIAIYRDEGGLIWCFPSDRFDTLIETKVNPYTRNNLPKEFVKSLEDKNELLSKLGLKSSTTNNRTPMTFKEALDNLDIEDKLDDEGSNISVQRMLKLGEKYGISSSTINNVPKGTLSKALRSVGFNQDFTSFSNRHSLITTSKIVNELDQNQLKTFFTIITKPGW